MIKNRVRRTAFATTVVAVALLSGACGYREVDLAVTGAEKIPGMGELYATCNPEGTLVYFTKTAGSEDEYEAFFANACYRDPRTGKIIYTYDRPVAPQSANGPIPDGDLGNSQPGTEGENE